MPELSVPLAREGGVGISEINSELMQAPLPIEDESSFPSGNEVIAADEVALFRASGGGDPLVSFLEAQRDCLKFKPQETLAWLRQQDITSMDDLRDACNDMDFVDLDFKEHGGLKGYKRRPFLKALQYHEL